MKDGGSSLVETDDKNGESLREKKKFGCGPDDESSDATGHRCGGDKEPALNITACREKTGEKQAFMSSELVPEGVSLQN